MHDHQHDETALPTVIRNADTETYSPPRHSGTTNRRLLDGSVTNGLYNVVHGHIEHGGEAEEHHHRYSTQFLHILSGSCRVTLDSAVVILESGESVFIPVGVRHHVEVLDPAGITLINVYQPALASDDTLA